jgi:hypothetical protein
MPTSGRVHEKRARRLFLSIATRENGKIDDEIGNMLANRMAANCKFRLTREQNIFSIFFKMTITRVVWQRSQIWNCHIEFETITRCVAKFVVTFRWSV